MGFKKTHKILILIFLLVLLIRLYFVFQTTYLENDGYLVKRYVEHILKTGEPLVYDSLSYNGREVLYSPLYHYILAFFASFLGVDLALKLIPAIFISLLVIIVFGLAKSLVDNEGLALFIALVSGFIPVVFVETLINASIYTLVVPVMFYMIYLFMKVGNSRQIKEFIFFSFFLSLLHPAAILFSVGLLFYFVLASSEGVRIPALRQELMVFNILSTFFIQFLIYKKAFLKYGMGVVWGNVPIQILNNYFDFNWWGLLNNMGALVILFGLVGLIWGIAKKKDRMFLIGGSSLGALMLLWLRLLDPKIGLIFLSTALVVTSIFALNILLVYLEKTKLPKYRIAFMILILSLFILTLAIPTFVNASSYIETKVPSEYEVLVLNWIKKEALPDVTVLAPLGKGHVITEVAGKRNVIDDNFLFAPDTSERYEDVQTIYSTNSEVTALSLISKHNIDYIFIPIEVELKYGRVRWIDDTHCFKGIFFGTPKVYQVIC